MRLVLLAVAEEVYLAEAYITQTGFLTAADKEMASAELQGKHGVIIMHAEYEQAPIFDDEKVHNGTLELGAILPGGQAVYDAPVPVKVLFQRPA